MKTTHANHHLLMAALLCVVFTAEIHCQTTAFTYQGSLANNGNPATGLYDLRFSIYDAVSGGAQQGSALTNTATVVSNGLFTAQLEHRQVNSPDDAPLFGRRQVHEEHAVEAFRPRKLRREFRDVVAGADHEHVRRVVVQPR